MATNTFDEGIEPGGLRDKDQIKLLICYILYNIKTPLSQDKVVGILQKNGLANYFESADAFSTLIKNGNLTASDDDKNLYTVSHSGKIISRQLENELPQSVKDKAMGAVLMLLEQERVEKENVVKINKTEKGYNVNCNISDGSMSLFNFDIYVPDKTQALAVKRNFHKNPDLIYQVMIAMLTGNKDFANEALESIKNVKKRGKSFSEN